jgi:hypothetical protein
MNGKLLEISPDGWTTVTSALPGAAISAEEMKASSCPLTYSVVLGVPFQSTREPLFVKGEGEMKFLPFTVKVKLEVPATSFGG